MYHLNCLLYLIFMAFESQKRLSELTLCRISSMSPLCETASPFNGGSAPANAEYIPHVTHLGLEKGAIGEAATKPRAVLAVECGEGKNAAPRSLLVHFVTKSDREKWCMLQGINDFFFLFLKKSNLRSRGQTSLERSLRVSGVVGSIVLGCRDCVFGVLVFERCSELKVHAVMPCERVQTLTLFFLGGWLFFYLWKLRCNIRVTSFFWTPLLLSEKSFCFAWLGFGKTLTSQTNGHCLTGGEKLMREVKLVNLWCSIRQPNELFMGNVHTSIKLIRDLFIFRWNDVWPSVKTPLTFILWR